MYIISIYKVDQILYILLNNKYLFLRKFFVFYNIITSKIPSLLPIH